MQKMKKQKIQEILDAQNAAINADMVSLFYLKDSYSDILFVYFVVYGLSNMMAIIERFIF